MAEEYSTYGQNNHPGFKQIPDDNISEIHHLQNVESNERLINKYISLCNSISEGFCIFQLIIDENGNPADCIFREVNPAFERQTGLHNPVGRSLKEYAPAEFRHWLKHYKQFFIEREPVRFLDFSKKLGKWFEGTAYFFGDPEEHSVAIIFNDITGKKKAEEELKESKERYKSLIETNIDFIWEMDTEGRYSYCSPQVEKLWGFKPDEFIGKSTFDFLPPEEKERALRLFKNGVSSPGDFSQFESISYNKEGKIVYVETSGTPYYNESGELLGFRGITRDITWRKKAEQEYIKSQMALKESEARFRSIVETANEGICMVDKKLIIKYVNSKICEMTGFSQDEMTGRSIFGYVKKNDMFRINKILDRINEKVKNDFEISIIKKDGSCVTVLANTTVINDVNGDIVSYVGMVTDISARIAIEKDLKKTKRKLEIALNNGKIGTWEWNIRTNEVVWDNRMEEMFNLKPNTFGGTLTAFESCVHEEDLPYVRDAIREALHNGKSYEVVYRTMPVNGKSNYISSKALVARSRKGTPLFLSGVAFDITDMKEGAENVLIKLNEELLRSNSDLRQFAAVASHDLQEPLRMVASYTQLLQQKYKDKLDQDAIDYINYAVTGSKRMYEMINGLLTYSRLNSRGNKFEPVDMNDVLQKVKDNLSLLIKDRNAVILSEELPVVFADKYLIEQLLQNLIENSIKFCEASPRIYIYSELAETNYIFSVEDNGIGIESQYFEKIFRIFQRLNATEQYKGAGVGLAICKRIVERHSGKIWVKSEPGKGTTFFFYLPKEKEHLFTLSGN